MTWRQKAFARAKKLGVDIVDLCGAHFDYEAVAPDGYHFKEEQLHGFVIWQYKGFTTEPLWRDLYERMEGGLEKCTYDKHGECIVG